MNQIVWLASFPKSGNTWLRVFLINYMDNGSEPADINNLRLPIASTPGIFNEYTGLDAADLTHDEVDLLRPDVYLHYAASNQGRELNDLKFFKVHDAYTYLPDGRPLFPPEATHGIIYILRNPLDVVVSYSHFNSQSIESAIENMAKDTLAASAATDSGQRQLRQKWMSWSSHVDSWNTVPNIPRLLIRYEDMVTNSLQVFQSVVRFLGFEDDLERLERSISFASFDVLKAQEQKHGFVENLSRNDTFFRKGQVGGWRDVLSHDHVIELISAHHDTMRRYGYLTPDGKIVF